MAERSVGKMLPEDCPYTVRCVSDIMGSNGSTSMASVCGASLALMDAGIGLRKNVAGISVGLVTGEDGEKTYLTDILGDEDHFGDMDFKVAGTEDGITGFQLDLKIRGLDIESMYEAMLQNKEARLRILEAMDRCLAEPRETLSPYAPKVEEVRINPEKISALIGPGGKTIREITDTTGVQIDVDESGVVKIYSSEAEALAKAVEEVRKRTAEAEVGKIYRGKVKAVKDFGAIVEILPGQSGLLHISELADYHVDKVEDICKTGDTVTVKVKGVDPERGRISLSRKEALEEIE